MRPTIDRPEPYLHAHPNHTEAGPERQARPQSTGRPCMDEESTNHQQGRVLGKTGKPQGHTAHNPPARGRAPLASTAGLCPSHERECGQRTQHQIWHQAPLQTKQCDGCGQPANTRHPVPTGVALREETHRPTQQCGPGQRQGHLQATNHLRLDAGLLGPHPHPPQVERWVSVDKGIHLSLTVPGRPRSPPVVGSRGVELSRNGQVALFVENRERCRQQGCDERCQQG